MKQAKIEDLFDYLPKSKIKAGDGLEKGGYPFYTSSENQSKYLNDFQHGPGYLVFGTGGKASVHLTTSRFSTSTDCITIKPKPVTEIDAGYVFQYFKGNMQILENGFKGAGLKHISKAYLSDIQIPYPDEIDDQRRIANLLGKVEGLIAQRKQHLQQLDDLIKSVFLEMFGDPVRNQKDWDKPELWTIISNMRNGLSPSKTGTHKGRVYTLSAVTGECFREIYKEDIFSQIHEKYFPTPNDFLLCRGNGNLSMVGKGYFFPGKSVEVIFPDTIIAVSMRPDAVNRSFFEALWKTKFIRQQIESNARTTNGAHKINQGVIEKIKIIQPPIDLQNQFSAIVEKVDSLKSRYQQSLTDLETLYGALSQQAFQGELDLSRVPLPDIKHQEEKTVVTEPLPAHPEQGDAIILPNISVLLDAVQGPVRQQDVMTYWLEAYRGQRNTTPFSVQRFMAAAQTCLAEMQPEIDFELGAKDYEHIKAWVFEALATDKLKQSMNDAGNRIQLMAAQA